ncbi:MULTISPECIES: hypothetical protein [unclassified Streptomyces]|uniref:hypothetical protein n=1 Tax=unclassified Streptomyces TaxID=2593676 RepID=UPI0029B89826|nr:MULTISPECIES: hypothetical protein [unclassified Streptomyces]MDX3772220.1 hypothetical protein [Streptomyces sp. AK08-01B]MDX3821767.1 hypothetical protein [Streptomyces sp. AK08-01A]
MACLEPPPSARTTNRRVRWLIVVGLIAVIAVITAVLGYQAPTVFVPLAFLVTLECSSQ